MSQNLPPNDMSSSEDESENFRSNIQLPHLDLTNYRKQQTKASSKTNLAKAGKKLKSKSVRFPDLYAPRDSIMSNSSTANNSSEDESLGPGTSVDPSLPSFSHANQSTAQPVTDDENEQYQSDMGGSSHSYRAPEYDDSDEEEEDYFASNTNHEAPNRGAPVAAEDGFRSGGSLLLHGEMDITDQMEKTTSISSNSRKSGEKKGGFKDLLRKIAFVDSDSPEDQADGYAPSQSDTFLGRVMSMSGNTGGTGGLVPGASYNNKEKPLDEEEELGMDPERSNNMIEMKRLDFAQLNSEAQNLITSHVPEAVNMLPEGDENGFHDDSAYNSTANLINNEEDHDEDHRTGFYAPNPDHFLRGEGRDDSDDDDDFLMDDAGIDIPAPKQVQAGVLSSLLRLYQNPQEQQSTSTLGSYGETTLAGDHDESTDKLFDSKNTSTVDFTKLKNGIKHAPKSMVNKIPRKRNHAKSGVNEDGEYDEKSDSANLPSFQNARPKAPKKLTSAGKVPAKVHKKMKERKKQQQQQLRITVHIADILQRQRFIIRMCRALMTYGAPTHRLEEYMVMTSRVLEIDGQFVYFPGVMIISFGDASTRTSEVNLVRCAQGLNLSKLADTHRIYKAVIHDLMSVDEASTQLEELLKRKNIFAPWVCVLLYALGSALVCPFAFKGGWLDMPICFGVGLCVGYLQFFVSSKSNLYSSVFEVTASIVVTFIARAIGNIHHGKIFCFSAIAQGSLALILPGYIILTGSLELQSRNIVAGSVRMFYAIIYSLFLGFGITLGASLYGWVDKSARGVQDCKHAVDPKFYILFVPLFSSCLGLINQAAWRQLPVMIIIACTGYVGTFFAGKHFANVPEFSAAIGAFIVGIMGNMYSRIWKGMAVSAMLPAIFVQVPSGIASQSSLLSGVKSADSILDKDNSTKVDSASSLSFGATMVEVSIGISVGLFAATLVVYPLGKKKTGLFSL